MKRLKRFIPFLMLLVSAVVLMGANPFADKTMAPVDLLLQYPGWGSADLPMGVAHPDRSDILDSRLPSWRFLKQRLRAGELPLWNPLRANGSPGLQLVSQSALTPAFLIFALTRDDALGFYLACLVNLVISAAGAFLLLRLITSSNLAALFGAITYAYSGFHAAWFYWPQVNTSIWIPWVLFFLARYLAEPSPRHLPPIALASAAMIFGGFPTVAAYGFAAAALLILVHLGVGFRSSLRPSVLALAFIGLGFALTLFALVPLAEQLGYSGAGNRTGGTILRLTDFLLFLDPFRDGGPQVERTVYAGIPALALGLLGALAYLFGPLRGELYARYGVWLLGISVVITFGLVHHGLIRALPTMGSNPWARVSVLIPLALALLSALFLARIAPRLVRHRPALAALVVCLMLVQFVDQKRLFAAFNKPVPAAAFYPSTPTIERIQTHLQPLQSLLGDSSLYMVSGTLTAYGLPEWFAHGFRSRAEKRALGYLVGKAFVTPTAAVIRCPNIRFDPELLAMAGVRYLICSDGGTPAYQAGPGRAECGASAALPTAELVQPLSLAHSTRISGLYLRFGTHGGKGLAGSVRVQVTRDGDDIAASEVSAARIEDNSWTRLPLGPGVELGPGAYRLRVDWLHPEPGGRLSLWTQGAAEEADRLRVDGQRVPCSLELRVDTLPADPESGFVVSRPEPGVRLLENPLMDDSGAYFLPALEPPWHADFAKVRYLGDSGNGIRVSYSDSSPGWVVLPVRAYPGWRAYVNGGAVEFRRFVDLMPAIPVEGPSEVEFRYRPVNLYLAAGVSLGAWLLLGFLFWRLRSARPS